MSVSLVTKLGVGMYSLGLAERCCASACAKHCAAFWRCDLIAAQWFTVSFLGGAEGRDRTVNSINFTGSNRRQRILCLQVRGHWRIGTGAGTGAVEHVTKTTCMDKEGGHSRAPQCGDAGDHLAREGGPPHVFEKIGGWSRQGFSKAGVVALSLSLSHGG